MIENNKTEKKKKKEREKNMFILTCKKFMTFVHHLMLKINQRERMSFKEFNVTYRLKMMIMVF
jgi:hypothetical protein